MPPTEQRVITLELDELDYGAIQEAFAMRQSFRDRAGCIMPDGDSNTAGALVAEICRGWLEMLTGFAGGEPED